MALLWLPRLWWPRRLVPLLLREELRDPMLEAAQPSAAVATAGGNRPQI